MRADLRRTRIQDACFSTASDGGDVGFSAFHSGILVNQN